MLKSAAAALLLVTAFGIGIGTGASLRIAPAGEITCLGNFVSVKNVTWKDVAYQPNDAADLFTAISEAVCRRTVRGISLHGIGFAP